MTIHSRLFAVASVVLLLFPAVLAAAEPTVPLGAAKVDVTPDGPIRLTGYASRKTESEGVEQRLWAKALAIGADAGEGPAVLVVVDNCGVPANLTAEVSARLKTKAGLTPARLVICSTHTHAGPWLPGYLKRIFAQPLSADEESHRVAYGRQLVDRLEQVALAALAARQPGHLAWAEGAAHFAMNRRPVGKEGRCRGLGVCSSGPVDPSLPVLRATDAQGKILAIVLNYACHGTTIGGNYNRIHGDWPGMAGEMIEAAHPGAVVLTCVGCGGDANPEPRGKVEMTQDHGRAIADEVNRLLKGKLAPIGPALVARREEFKLPLDTLPTRQELEARVAAGRDPKAAWPVKSAAMHAAYSLADLDQNHSLPTEVPYHVTVWSLGRDFSMVFMPGEVVVDYALRLKRELDGPRLWVTAYADDVPCYIVSRRVLEEGGYEPVSSMIYYGLPTQLAPAVEDRIVTAAKGLAQQCRQALPASEKDKPAAAGSSAIPAKPSGWKAGVAAVRITPETPLWMAGYASRTKPSEGVAQDLFAKALAIEDVQGNRLVIVTMDLIGVDRPLRDWLEKQTQEKFGLRPASLLLNVSHTHCGPAVNAKNPVFDVQSSQKAPVASYRELLQEKLVAVIGEAIGRLAPSQLDYLYARCAFAMNRRRPIPSPTGTRYQNAPNSEGPVDHAVPVLRVQDSAGKLRAVLFGYACHNTCMGDYKFRGDYAGYAQECLEQAHPGTIALFLQGCGGDQNPYPRRTEELARTHGRTLATAVDAALETVPHPLAGPLSTAIDDAIVEFAPPPSREDLEKIAATKKRPDAGHAQRLLKQLSEPGGIRTSYPCPIQVVRFGEDLTLAAISGETVIDYSVRLKRELPGAAVWVAGYSNDVFGYLPSLRVLQEGGYEGAEAAFWGSLPGAFAPTIEDRIVAKVHELLKPGAGRK